MEVAVSVPLEAVTEGARCHLFCDIFNLAELVLDEGIITKIMVKRENKIQQGDVPTEAGQIAQPKRSKPHPPVLSIPAILGTRVVEV